MAKGTPALDGWNPAVSTSQRGVKTRENKTKEQMEGGHVRLDLRDSGANSMLRESAFKASGANIPQLVHGDACLNDLDDPAGRI